MSKLGKTVEEWIRGDLSAIVLREYLIPVEGKYSPFFPPTFAGDNNDKNDKGGYCIDTMRDGTKTCLIDTVGSQANRMEPIFTNKKYAKLIPQVTIKYAQDGKINICEVGHRAADALLRNSSIYNEKLKDALEDLRSDPSKIAKIAPTSLVFGLWDSRGSQEKSPRIVSSVIRAYDIDELRRSSQYNPPINYIREELLEDHRNESKEMDARSSLGFHDKPSVNTHGGIIARGDIRKDTVINFAALRKITMEDENEELKLQKYILGLAMVAATYKQDGYLRQGCSLTIDLEQPAAEWELVYPDGKREKTDISHDDVKAFAEEAAGAFGVGKDRDDVEFDEKSSEEEIEHKKNRG